MDFKSEYGRLIKLLKNSLREAGEKDRNEDIAERLNYSRSYFSTLINKNGVVTEDHLKDLLLRFPILRKETEFKVLDNITLDMLPKQNNQDLTMQALVNLTESNRDQSTSMKSISRSHEELVFMIKGAKLTEGATVGVHSQSEVETLSTLLGMRRLLEQIAAKVNKQPLESVQDALDNMVKEERQILEHKGSSAVSGRQSKG